MSTDGALCARHRVVPSCPDSPELHQSPHSGLDCSSRSQLQDLRLPGVKRLAIAHTADGRDSVQTHVCLIPVLPRAWQQVSKMQTGFQAVCHSSAWLTLGRSPRLRSHIYKTRLILRVARPVVKMNRGPLCPYRNACRLVEAGGCAGP